MARPAVDPARAVLREDPGQVRLNNWIEAFGLETFQRHHALGDGLMIAQMLIAASVEAARSVR